MEVATGLVSLAFIYQLPPAQAIHTMTELINYTTNNQLTH